MFVRNCRDLRTAYQQGKYSAVGFYPLFFVASDSEAMCHDCVGQHYRAVADAVRLGSKDPWRVDALDINWEDPLLYCAHCGERIESAYAEP